jgi:hypothetical protein
MTNTTIAIKPLTPLMTAMLLDVADKGRAVAKGRELITLRGLENRGLVEIISREDKLFSEVGETLVYTTTDVGFAKAVELL